MTTVADISRIIEKIAPGRLAEDWDNTGLQFGDPAWRADHVFICLDPTPEALAAAVAAGADILVTHHPFIFRPFKSIDISTPAGAMIHKAAVNNISLLSAHTNLDSVKGGINDVLAEKIGLDIEAPLSPANPEPVFKFVIFAPEDNSADILDALGRSPAGRMGSYSACSFHHKGKGRFIPGPESRPHAGIPGELSEVGEVRIESLVMKRDLKAVIDAVSRVHPYETVPCDVYPLHRFDSQEGIGRIGTFETMRPLVKVAEDIKERLGLKAVKFAGSADMMVGRAAVCSGGGAGLLKEFHASSAQVLISGDMNHHAALDTAALGKGLIDIGHFASEQLIVPVLGKMIEKGLADSGLSAKVTTWGEEPDPFTHI